MAQTSAHLTHFADRHLFGDMPPRATHGQDVAIMHKVRRHCCCVPCSLPHVLRPGSLGEAKAELPISSSPSPHLSASLYACLVMHRHGCHGRLPCRSATAAAGIALPILHPSWLRQRIPCTSPHLSGSSPRWLRFRSWLPSEHRPSGHRSPWRDHLRSLRGEPPPPVDAREARVAPPPMATSSTGIGLALLPYFAGRAELWQPPATPRQAVNTHGHR
jgi:hypothetical protein